MNRRGFMGCVMAILLLAVSGPAFGQSAKFVLQREGKKTWLQSGKNRLLVLEDQEEGKSISPNQITLSGDNRLEFSWGKIVRFKGGVEQETFLIKDVFDKWLADDAFWGGKEAANDARYVQNEMEGMTGTFNNALVFGDSALVVLSWNISSLMGEPTHTQHLVRIRTEPNLTVEPLRALRLYPDGSKFARFRNSVRRLFSYGDSLFSLETNQVITEIDKTGKILKTRGKVPAYYEIEGRVAERWLVVSNAVSKDKNPVRLFDLKTNQLAILPGKWERTWYQPRIGYVIALPETGNQALLRDSSAESSRQVFVVTIPTGRRVPIIGPEGDEEWWLWQNRVVCRTGDAIHLYNPATGKRVQRLALKRK